MGWANELRRQSRESADSGQSTTAYVPCASIRIAQTNRKVALMASPIHAVEEISIGRRGFTGCEDFFASKRFVFIDNPFASEHLKLSPIPPRLTWPPWFSQVVAGFSGLIGIATAVCGFFHLFWQVFSREKATVFALAATRTTNGEIPRASPKSRSHGSTRMTRTKERSDPCKSVLIRGSFPSSLAPARPGCENHG
jgi:hypothetical protein